MSKWWDLLGMEYHIGNINHDVSILTALLKNAEDDKTRSELCSIIAELGNSADFANEVMEELKEEALQEQAEKGR